MTRRGFIGTLIGTAAVAIAPQLPALRPLPVTAFSFNCVTGMLRRGDIFTIGTLPLLPGTQTFRITAIVTSEGGDTFSLERL